MEYLNPAFVAFEMSNGNENISKYDWTFEQIQIDAKKNYSEAFDKVDRHRGYNTF
jgi:hypothetical protein